MRNRMCVRELWRGTALTVLSAALLAPAAVAQTGAPPSSRPANGERPAPVDPAQAAPAERQGQLGGQATAAPDAEAEPLTATVLEVSGRVRGRAPGAEGLTGVKVGDILSAGTLIKTSANSFVVVRLGHNATARVNSLAIMTIAQLAESPDRLITSIGLERGDMDVRVDKTGKENDFTVATPSATLAVAGTSFNISHDAIDGTRITGVDTNRLDAIRVRFSGAQIAQAFGRGAISERHRNPALAALDRSLPGGLQGDSGRGGLGTRLFFPAAGVAMVQATTGRIAALREQTLEENIMEFSMPIRDANESPPFGGNPIP